MLIEDTDAPEGGESNPNTETEAPDPIKSKLDELESQNADLMNKLNTFLAAQNAPKNEPEKRMSPEEFKALSERDPQAAMEYALKNVVRAETQGIEKKLTTTSQAQYYDQKVEQDFPLIKKDKEFQALVRAETKNLVNDGMNPDSPKLVYKAAEIAALKHKGAQDTKTGKEKKEITSEAPSNIKKTEDVKVPKNAEKMFKSFNMSPKAQEIYKQNLAAKADEDRRKGRE
jgi:hypothetical protein